MPRSRGHDGLRLVTDQVMHDGDIVGGKVPDDVHVVLKKTQINPYGVEVVEVSKDMVFDELLEFLDGACVEEGMIHHDFLVFLLGQLDEFLRLGDRVSERLFDEDALAFLDRHLGQFIVGKHRRGDGHGIDLRVFDYCCAIRGDPDVGVCFFDLLEGLGIHVADHGDLRFVGQAEVPHDVRTPVAVTNDAYAKHKNSSLKERVNSE